MPLRRKHRPGRAKMNSANKERKRAEWRVRTVVGPCEQALVSALLIETRLNLRLKQRRIRAFVARILVSVEYKTLSLRVAVRDS